MRISSLLILTTATLTLANPWAAYESDDLDFHTRDLSSEDFDLYARDFDLEERDTEFDDFSELHTREQEVEFEGWLNKRGLVCTFLSFLSMIKK